MVSSRASKRAALGARSASNNCDTKPSRSRPEPTPNDEMPIIYLIFKPALAEVFLHYCQIQTVIRLFALQISAPPRKEFAG